MQRNEKQFWSRVCITADSEKCWEWQGGLYSNGYGQVTYQNQKYVAHRLSWFLTYGQLPTKLLLHSCDNRKCVNPSHLREGTNQDNAEDMVRKNRQAKGELVANAKLTALDILQIRELGKKGITQRSISAQFGIAQAAICDIINRKRWAHVQSYAAITEEKNERNDK